MAAMNPLAEWQNFYMIMGSAAGALTGLQFVVMALIADMPMRPGEDNTSNAFATPTIVHFVAVLLLSASVAIPWHDNLLAASIAWRLAGIAGLLYIFVICRRMRHQTGYQPVAEDWVFHAALPLLAYVALVSAALCITPSHMRAGLFGLAAAVALLLCIGIHNAWDNVTYLVFVKRQRMN
jgi:hypothetical protein